MKRVELIHRGHVAATGFIIDVPTIGELEARVACSKCSFQQIDCFSCLTSVGSC